MPCGVVAAPRVDAAVAVAVAEHPRLLARGDVEGDEGVGAAVVVGVLLLLLEAALGIVEVDELEVAVGVLVELDAHDPAFTPLLDPVGPSLALAVDDLALHLPGGVVDLGLEAAVEVLVQLLGGERLAVRGVVVAGVDLPVVVPVLFLARAHAAPGLDEGVRPAVAVRVGLAAPRLVALEVGDDVGLPVARRVLLLADLAALLEPAHQVEAAAALAVELLQLAVAVRGEGDHRVGPAVLVEVAHLLALDAALVGRLGVEAPVAVGVGAAPEDPVAVVLGDGVHPAVAIGVLLGAHALAGLVGDARVRAPVAVLVLLLAALRAVGLELGAQVGLAVAGGVLLDDGRLARRVVGDDAVGAPVAVRVLLAAGRHAVLEDEAGVGLAVAVPVVALRGGLAALGTRSTGRRVPSWLVSASWRAGWAEASNQIQTSMRPSRLVSCSARSGLPPAP